jgi:hypothetical protein
MKIEDLEVVCCSSVNDPNTWYIFRANSVEVKIVLVEKQFKANKEFTDLEIEYLNNNLK